MQDDPISIRPARAEDEAAIRAQSAATNAAHRARLPHVFRPTNAYQEQLLDVALNPQAQVQGSYRSTVYVAHRGDAALGFALVIWSAPQDADAPEHTTALIADIATFDGARGQGVGAALLAHLEQQMGPQGWDSLLADVWLGNDASHGLFQKAGFAAERTEYRLGTPQPLPDTPCDDTDGKRPGPPWRMILIVLVIIALIVSFP